MCFLALFALEALAVHRAYYDQPPPNMKPMHHWQCMQGHGWVATIPPPPGAAPECRAHSLENFLKRVDIIYMTRDLRGYETVSRKYVQM